MTDTRTSLCDQHTLDTLANTVMQDPPERAIEALDDTLRLHPRDGRLLLLRGSVFASLKETDKARTDFTRAMILSPSLGEARLMLGQLEYGEGNQDEARAIWAGFVAPDAPHNAVTLIGAAMLGLLDGHVDTATPQLQEALRLTPSDALRQHAEDLLARLAGPTSDDNATESMSHYLLSDSLTSQSRH